MIEIALAESIKKKMLRMSIKTAPAGKVGENNQDY
jgi:hypothetical protein